MFTWENWREKPVNSTEEVESQEKHCCRNGREGVSKRKREEASVRGQREGLGNATGLGIRR